MAFPNVSDIVATTIESRTKEIADNVITDAVLRDFGIIVLEQYRQEPLNRKLDEIVAVIKRPVVVDAVRDLRVCFKNPERTHFLGDSIGLAGKKAHENEISY